MSDPYLGRTLVAYVNARTLLSLENAQFQRKVRPVSVYTDLRSLQVISGHYTIEHIEDALLELLSDGKLKYNSSAGFTTLNADLDPQDTYLHSWTNDFIKSLTE